MQHCCFEIKYILHRLSDWRVEALGVVERERERDGNGKRIAVVAHCTNGTEYDDDDDDGERRGDEKCFEKK